MYVFTGIVEEMGAVKKIDFYGNVNKLKISCKETLRDIKLGDSISVNGVCLTVSQLGDDWFEVDVMPETLRRTSLSTLKVGEKVNLEAALKLGARLGGHIVSGHIDCVGIIKEVKEEQNAVWIIIQVPDNLMKYIIMKGSIAIEGTSLTIANVETNNFGVSLIPTTRFITTLGYKKAGDKVNIECDIIGKYIEKLLNVNEKVHTKQGSGIDANFLQSNGFI